MENKKRICHWCNENEMAESSWGGCASCPTIPYKCTCDVQDEPHDISCERNPNFAGERKPDPEREKLLGYDSFDIGSDPIFTLRYYMDGEGNIIPRFKVLSCEQDPIDKSKFTVVFEWQED